MLTGSRTCFRITLVIALIAILIPGPSVSAAKKKPTPLSGIQGDERILHALNRFTFGPRPGDIDIVKQIGLERWFDEQLHPEKINDAALEERLSSYPAMRLSQAELLHRFPNQQIIRQVIQQKIPLPTDPEEQAIYRNAIAKYEQIKAKQEQSTITSERSTESKSTQMVSTNPTLASDGFDFGTPAMVTHEEQLFSGLEAIKIINLPPSERMTRILAMQPDEAANFRRSLSPAELAAAADGLSPEQKEVLAALEAPARVVGAEVTASRLLRDIYSERQLEAVMTDFWLNHFNVFIRKNQNEPYLLPEYERVIRAHALGRFEDLLVATAKSPAMLVYLDNAQSIGPNSIAANRMARLRAASPDAKLGNAVPQGLNENYARELMELHTLGVNGGYTQADVTALAKVFTGWTVQPPLRGGEFQFEEKRHEPGEKKLLGVTIREGGEQEGLQLLHILASSPATAKFIANKIAIRFVSDNPPPVLVDRMAAAYLSSGGDIAAVLRTMFQSPEFWSPAVDQAKVKTPQEFVISAVRATGADVRNASPLVRELDKLGMPLYGMQTPNGYSWLSEPWMSSGALVSRMNFAVALGFDRIGGTYLDWKKVLDNHRATSIAVGADTEVSAKQHALELLLLCRSASDQTRTAVIAELDREKSGQQSEHDFGIRVREPEPMQAVLSASGPMLPMRAPIDREAALIAGLLLGSPEFQRR